MDGKYIVAYWRRKKDYANTVSDVEVMTPREFIDKCGYIPVTDGWGPCSWNDVECHINDGGSIDYSGLRDLNGEILSQDHPEDAADSIIVSAAVHAKLGVTPFVPSCQDVDNVMDDNESDQSGNDMLIEACCVAYGQEYAAQLRACHSSSVLAVSAHCIARKLSDLYGGRVTADDIERAVDENIATRRNLEPSQKHHACDAVSKLLGFDD